ncbi:Wzz/FepE/Etk N-terminal domain-containing protein [Arthrobacter sp. Br18]|uniref:Wzz/FepE/Etk N-terminal domain-containing protein n=1 Tax=Arthrobacter sp. Br18 TaxID=1312954 RepID=UPI00047E8A60|nr:Wzz/FepE/Etk N-terminal domain-containing protein [Arthrobacter sp. Br18]
MELSEYLRIFRRRWLLIASVTLLAIAAALTVTGLTPASYEARAVLFIKAFSPTSSSYENSQFSLQRVRSYPDLVYSPQVLNPVLERLGSSASLASLSNRVSASNPEDTVYVNVLATAGTADQAAVLANLVAESLRDEISALESGVAAQSAAVQPSITVPAVPPTSPSTPDPLLNVAVGALLGLTVGLMAALAFGRSNIRIYTAADIRQTTGLELIGRIPPIRNQSSRWPAPSAMLPYREVNTNLLVSAGGQIPRLLLLASAGDDADFDRGVFRRGFAAFLGYSGSRTCVLEATQSYPLPADQEARTPGFSDILTGSVTVADALRVIEHEPVHLVQEGTASRSITRSDAARKGATIVKELAENFDVLITQASYDSHPLSTAVMTPIADGVLVLVRPGERAAALHTVVRELTALGVKPLGVVLTGARSRPFGPAHNGKASGVHRQILS